MKQGVERDKHLHTKAMGVFDQLGDVFQGVASRLARTKLRRTDVHCICTRLNGCDTYL